MQKYAIVRKEEGVFKKIVKCAKIGGGISENRQRWMVPNNVSLHVVVPCIILLVL